MKRYFYILFAGLLGLALLLVQFPREAVHEMVHPDCGHDHHACDEPSHAKALVDVIDWDQTTHYAEFCPLFQELLLAYAGILTVDALAIDNPMFVTAYASATAEPIQADRIVATARGPPESC